MRARKIAALLPVAFLVLIPASPLIAGGFLETFDITGRVPSPTGGNEIVARVVPVRWDDRCLPVPLRLNDTLDPIPNPLGTDFVSLADVVDTLDSASDAWNRLPTSYFQANRVGTVSNPGFRTFDTVNEITFRSPSFLFGFARTALFTLMEDTRLVAGDDVDGDGDSDVAAGITTCADVDADGDVEFPSGFYPAGTILDSDIELNVRPNGFRFTVDPADADTNPASVDLEAVILHELGHVQGLAHSMTNQISATDGGPSTLFAGIDTNDPDDELAFRSLTVEDVAAASLHYPEGSAGSGPAALQAGDVAFEEVFGIIEGEAFDGDTGIPLAGGSVFAVDLQTGRRVSSAITGTVFGVLGPTSTLPRSLPDAQGIVDGRYRLAVPHGPHLVGLEGPDGTPLFASAINETTIEGSVNRQVDFLEEFFNRGTEDDLEHTPGRGVPIPVGSEGTATLGIDFVTERSRFLQPFDTNVIGPARADAFVFIGADPGLYYAVQFPAAELQNALSDDDSLLVAGRFHTLSADRSQVPVFAEALVTTGRLLQDDTARIDVDHPLAREAPFVGQEDDLATLYFQASHGLTDRVREGLSSGQVEDLFLVLRVPLETPFPGVSNFPPLVGIDFNPGNSRGRSFTSGDGVVFEPADPFDFRFDLVTAEP